MNLDNVNFLNSRTQNMRIVYNKPAKIKNETNFVETDYHCARKEATN